MSILAKLKTELREAGVPVEKWNNIIDFCIAEHQNEESGMFWRDALAECLQELQTEQLGYGDWYAEDCY